MVFDVIVVESGSAGLSAAITAAENGASTLMVEKNAELGGTSGWSVGSITTSASPHQRAADIYDTPDQHFSDMELFHSERLEGRDNIKLRRLLVDYRRNRPDIFFRASSLAELASKTGMDPAKLEEAVMNYNAKDASGERRPFVTPPFVALGPVQSYIMSSDGGLAVNENLQVLGMGNLPIPGLYAAGSTGQGGLLLEGHGHHLGWGCTSGRIAGRHAALAGQNNANRVFGQT